MAQEPPYELIKNFISGESDETGDSRLMEWLLESEENRRAFAETVAVVCAAEITDEATFESRRQAFLDRISRELDKEEAESRSRMRRRAYWSVSGGIAAAIAAIAVLGHGHPDAEYFYHAPETYATYSNTKDAADMISLPDGTMAWVKEGMAWARSPSSSQGI